MVIEPIHELAADVDRDLAPRDHRDDLALRADHVVERPDVRGLGSMPSMTCTAQRRPRSSWSSSSMAGTLGSLPRKCCFRMVAQLRLPLGRPLANLCPLPKVPFAFLLISVSERD
jgi:hypothetical protein